MSIEKLSGANAKAFGSCIGVVILAVFVGAALSKLLFGRGGGDGLIILMIAVAIFIFFPKYKRKAIAKFMESLVDARQVISDRKRILSELKGKSQADALAKLPFMCFIAEEVYSAAYNAELSIWALSFKANGETITAHFRNNENSSEIESFKEKINSENGTMVKVCGILYFPGEKHPTDSTENLQFPFLDNCVLID